MALVSLNISKGLGEAILFQLSRIADALDRLNPPIPESQLETHKRGVDAIVKYGDENKLWTRETFSNLIHEKGLAPAKEQEILDQAMSQYDLLEDGDDLDEL